MIVNTESGIVVERSSEDRADRQADRAAEHFQTDHLLGDLKGRSVRGGALTIGSQGAQFVLQLASTAILARLLTPADFGLIAMVATVTAFAALFKDLGLAQASVQRERLTHEQVSTLFWINVLASAAIGALVACSAPLVAWIYGEPRLVMVTIVLGGVFVFGGIAAQHTALLRRQMRFGPLALIDVAALALGIVAAVALAWAGASYWALVAMMGVQSLATAAGVWIASGWIPGRMQRGSGVMPMIRFGGHLTGFNVLNYFTRNFDNVLIGAFRGAAELGMYSKAYGLLMMPIRQMNAPVTAVAIPALSRLQQKPAEYRRYFLRAVGLLAFAGVPVVVFSAAAATEIVAILFGPGWEQVATIFRCLAPAALAGVLNVVPGWLCTSLGNTQRQLRWAIIAAPITVAGFVIGLNWGTVGVATAFSTTWCALLLWFIWYAGRGTPVGLGGVAGVSWRPLFASIVSATLAWWVLDALQHAAAPLLRLSAAGVCFGVLYLAVFAALPKGWRFLAEAAQLMPLLRRTAPS